MSLLFKIRAGTSVIATTHAKPSVTGIGVYSTKLDAVFQPDPEAVREALPHYWRKAFDRAGARFWFYSGAKIRDDNTEVNGGAYLRLCSTRGRHLVTLYATPYHFGA